jgi:replicative DNA helicase
MIIIDHFHLMHWAKSSSLIETQIAITKSLKQLAMELSVPIILLAQLKKPELQAGATRRDPVASDLKGSGSIITDADLIMVLQIDPSTRAADETRFVRNYILKNRGGRADGSWIGFAHYPSKCVMVSN